MFLQLVALFIHFHLKRVYFSRRAHEQLVLLVQVNEFAREPTGTLFKFVIGSKVLGIHVVGRKMTLMQTIQG